MINNEKNIKDKRKPVANPMVTIISLAVVGMLLLITGLLIFAPIPDNNKDVVYLIAGQIIGSFSSVISYWIGSSRGSFEKNKDLDKE